MKRILILLFLPLLMVDAQWQKFSDLNVGITGQIAIHNNKLFLYGSQSGFKLYRFDENGDNFADLTAGAGEGFSHLYNFNGVLYGIFITGVFTSNDNGESWNLLSNIPFSGGAIIKLVSDGSTLYGVSNRKSIFKSTDNGVTWEEKFLNHDGNLMFLNLAVSGNKYVGIVVGQGAYISDDDGTTWILNNPPTAASVIYNLNGIIFGLTGNGVYKLDSSTNTWLEKNSGLPNNGSLYTAKSLSKIGNTLILAGSELIGSKSTVFISEDMGESWREPDSDGLPQLSATGSFEFVVSNGANIFYYYYGLFDSQNIGLYKTQYNGTTGIQETGGTPEEFSLLQNYPNPFNPTTKINFSISESGFTKLNVYDILGNEVAELVNRNLPAGNYTFGFNASGLTSGIYICRLSSGNTFQINKMTLLK